jgi:hypothetical protein
MVLVPYICGRGFIKILKRAPGAGEYTHTDYLLTGVLISVGLTEAAHLFGVFGHRSVHEAMIVFYIEFAVAVLLSILLIVTEYLSAKKTKTGRPDIYRYTDSTSDKKDIYSAFLMVVIFLICFIVTQVNDNIYLEGDMTVETVNTFIGTDSFYTVNPLTGSAYTLGVPSRLKLLCLPSLFTFISETFHFSPVQVVWRIAPAFVMICCIAAYYNLSVALFKNDSVKKNIFMILVGVVLLIGNYMYGMDGFMALNSGFRGVALRNLVLIPYTISLVLRKKRLAVILCIIAEACVVWTLYGAGASLFIAVVLAAVERMVHDA